MRLLFVVCAKTTVGQLDDMAIVQAVKIFGKMLPIFSDTFHYQRSWSYQHQLKSMSVGKEVIEYKETLLHFHKIKHMEVWGIGGMHS